MTPFPPPSDKIKRFACANIPHKVSIVFCKGYITKQMKGVIMHAVIDIIMVY